MLNAIALAMCQLIVNVTFVAQHVLNTTEPKAAPKPF